MLANFGVILNAVKNLKKTIIQGVSKKMENLQIILSIAATAVGLLITTVTFLLKFINNTKAKNAAEGVIKIGNALLPYIEQAEQLAASGAAKKDFVMSLAAQFAQSHGIVFDAVAVSDKIEELLQLTKKVN